MSIDYINPKLQDDELKIQFDLGKNGATSLMTVKAMIYGNLINVNYISGEEAEKLYKALVGLGVADGQKTT